MKKLISLLLCLCLLAFCACAAAETKTVTDFDDFTLETSVEVTKGEKNPSTTLFSFLPLSASGDLATNVNSVYLGPGPFAGITAKGYSDALRSQETALRTQYSSAGIALDSLVMNDATDTEFWGLKAFEMDIEASGQNGTGTPFYLYQRQMVVFGDFGAYAFTVTASDKDVMKQVQEDLIASITWKK